jgi:hypothetical protein
MDRSLIGMIMGNYNKISTNGEEKGGVLDRTMDRSLIKMIKEILTLGGNFPITSCLCFFNTWREKFGKCIGIFYQFDAT